MEHGSNSRIGPSGNPLSHGPLKRGRSEAMQDLFVNQNGLMLIEQTWTRALVLMMPLV